MASDAVEKQSDDTAHTGRLENLLRARLELAPALLERLWLLADLRDSATQKTAVFGDLADLDETDSIMDAVHKEVLLQWLGKSWILRLVDASAFLNGIGSVGQQAVEKLIEAQAYRRLLPRRVAATHREHFLMAIPLVLRLARYES